MMGCQVQESGVNLSLIARGTAEDLWVPGTEETCDSILRSDGFIHEKQVCLSLGGGFKRAASGCADCALIGWKDPAD